MIEPRNLIIKNAPKPEPGPKDVLIRVLLGGICGSDHTLYHGGFSVPLPVIPGHEAVGRIEKIGEEVSGLAVGQRVTVQPNIACGRCRLCQTGQKNLCSSKVRLGVDKNGVFAEFVAAPANYVWPIPEELKDEVAVFTEPLAVAVHAMKIRAPQKVERILIYGAGIMGLLSLQLAAATGAQITACDIVESRLEMARQLGAARTIGTKEPVESYQNAFDVIYETSGAPGALDQVIRLAAPHGKIVVLSLPGKDHPLSTDLIVRKELHIMGSLIYTNEFPEAIDILKSGQIKTDLLNSGKLSLDDLDNALREFAAPERFKMLVEI